jgi:hypothetical protein
LLLSIELAAETPGLPVATAEKLRSARELVNKLRKQLETDHSAQEREAAATS